MEALLWLWPLAGICAHIIAANRMKTWCGTPVWEEPATYMMFFPAMILGPLMFFCLSGTE